MKSPDPKPESCPLAPVEARMSQPEMAPSRNYRFVDYATQGYSALVALLILVFHNDTIPRWPWLVAAHGIGIALVHLLIRTEPRGRFAPQIDFLRNFYPVLLYTRFFCESGWINRMFFPDYLDPLVIQWDQAVFGFQPSLLFMQKLPYLAVSELFYASYFSYYLMITGVGIALFLRNRRQFFHYISVVSFLFYVCYLIYVFVPVIGPRVFFQDLNGFVLPAEFRRLAPAMAYPPGIENGVFFRIMALIYDWFESPGAALPSSHVAVALCTVYFSFLYLRRIRYLHLIVALLLCLSTIYCHYHYGVDVIAGVVTAALVVPLGNWFYHKTQSWRPNNR